MLDGVPHISEALHSFSFCPSNWKTTDLCPSLWIISVYSPNVLENSSSEVFISDAAVFYYRIYMWFFTNNFYLFTDLLFVLPFSFCSSNIFEVADLNHLFIKSSI